MDIHINFENESEGVWIRNVTRRDVSSENYHVWYVEDGKYNEQTFETKKIKSVDVYNVPH